MSAKPLFAPALSMVEVDNPVSLVDSASGLLSEAEQHFADLRALFDAIVALPDTSSLPRDLAALGSRLSDRYSCDSGRNKDEYNAHALRLYRRNAVDE